MDLIENKKMMSDYKNNIITKEQFIEKIVDSMYSSLEECEENPITDGDWTFEKSDVKDVVAFLEKEHNITTDDDDDDDTFYWFGGFPDDTEIQEKFDIDEHSLYIAFANMIIDNEIYPAR